MLGPDGRGEERMSKLPDSLVRVRLADEMRRTLDAHCKRWGIDQIIVVSRIIEWVATQPQEVIAMIFVLNRHDCHDEIARKIFEEMARGR